MVNERYHVCNNITVSEKQDTNSAWIDERKDSIQMPLLEDIRDLIFNSRNLELWEDRFVWIKAST